MVLVDNSHFKTFELNPNFQIDWLTLLVLFLYNIKRKKKSFFKHCSPFRKNLGISHVSTIKFSYASNEALLKLDIFDIIQLLQH